ncbi:MAG TPA: hypothetical protein VKG89_00465, partial [Solirubrobacterales bacterium]|nr:hypothetical protein [Solirubrobacterales bacterium]
YGSQIEMVDLSSGRVLKVAHVAYGSFNLDAAPGLVATASLSRGALTVFDRRLRLRRILEIAPTARDVATTASRGR